MAAMLVARAKLEVKADPLWQWHGWNGVVEITLSGTGVSIDGNQLVTKQDLISLLQTELVGKSYSAPGFDVPGIVAPSQVQVLTTGTVPVKISMLEVAVECDEGIVMFSPMQPATNAVSGVPDGVWPKTATWKVTDAGQESVKVG